MCKILRRQNLWKNKTKHQQTNVRSGGGSFYNLLNKNNRNFSRIWKKFNYTGNVQEYKIAVSGDYKIELWGANGGTDTEEKGRGAYTAGTINLTKGEILYFYVGEKGESGTAGNDTTQTEGQGAPATYNGGGGSSYISGYTGCVAITSQTNITPKTGCQTGTTDNNCSVHYSNKKFTNTIMIDGSGYLWTNEKQTKTQMPKPDGTKYNLGEGNQGSGHAKITYIGN